MPLEIKYTTGFAGTGKSYSLIQKVKYLPIKTSVVLAPTHKALHRLRSELPLGIEIKTTHSLLGWIPTINESAKKTEHIDTTMKLDKQLDEYNHIVIDEAGMLSEEMFFEIVSKVEDYAGLDGEEGKDVEIHCFLDPYQLLPVKGQQLQTDPLTTTNLTTQHRAESLDIVNLYTKFVDYLIGTNKSDLSTPYSDNVLPLDISKFKLGDRLLAYTNKAVGEWNITIAKQLGIDSYEEQEVQLGSMLDLVMCEEFIAPTTKDLLDWFESGKLKIQNSQISKKFLEYSLNELIVNKDIKFITDYTYVYPVILGIGNANIVHMKAKEAAVKNRSKFKTVYALGRAYIMDYPFATTVHKSQGSEFNSVFIDKEDMQKSIFNGSYSTYARLMYVSLSRAIKQIYI